MPETSSAAPVADSPHLAQLKAREKMLKHKIAHRIPQFSERQEEAMGRAKTALSQVQEQIRSAVKAAKTSKP